MNTYSVFCMEIKEINNHALHCINHRITVKMVLLHSQSMPNVIEIEGTNMLLFFIEVYHWVVEER